MKEPSVSDGDNAVSATPPNPNDAPPGRLALADGSVFRGSAFGATGRGLCVEAEVVFNTALTGYQESITDPSYAGHILTQTAPLIGNTGANVEDVESDRVQVAGFIVHEAARRHSNFRAVESLQSYLASSGVLGLAGIDTRALVRKLRITGSMQGVLTDDASIPDAELVERARSAASMEGQNLVPLVGCSSNHRWSEDLGAWDRGVVNAGTEFRVLALDCGAKRNILRNLTERGCSVEVVPHDTPADEILRRFDEGGFDGIFVSNGPGDPAAVRNTVETLRRVLNHDKPVPTFGICLGHQLLALAAGAQTYKLKFGHRGANQPVRSSLSGRVEITSQNHGFAVDADSLRAVGGEATHVHLNDNTLAGFRLKDKPVFAVQYHPEASPGPHDASGLFDAFVESMRTKQSPLPVG